MGMHYERSVASALMKLTLEKETKTKSILSFLDIRKRNVCKGENILGVRKNVISMTLLCGGSDIYLQSFDPSLLSTHCMPGTILGAGNTARN